MTIFTLPARLTLDNAKAIHAQGVTLLKTAQHLTVDASALQEFDTAVLALCLDWCHLAQAHNVQIIMQSVPDAVLNLAHAFGVSELLPLSS